MLMHAYLSVMGLVASAYFVLWHGAIVVALARAAGRTEWRLRFPFLLVAAIIIAIVIGAMSVGIRDMPTTYLQYKAKRSGASLKP
jgi:hypothetical protein